MILNERQIQQKIRRMAYQIFEQNYKEQEIVLAGIWSSGYQLAEKLAKVLGEVADFDVQLCKLTINKKNPLDSITCSVGGETYRDKVVILADDVLNSGSTLMYGAKYFLDVPLKKLQTLVLVDRSHKKYPIKADFRGIHLSTSLNEMVKVSFDGEVKAELM